MQRLEAELRFLQNRTTFFDSNLNYTMGAAYRK